MVERLVTVLRALAADVGTVGDAEALAPDFEDALLLIRSCQQIDLTAEQARALSIVESTLDGMHGAANDGPRAGAHRRGGREWALVRDAAAVALRALGYPVGPGT